MRHFVTILLLAVLVVLPVAPANSYTLQYTSTAATTQIRWPSKTVTVAFSTSLTAPQSHIKPGSDVVGAARRALARWSEASGIQFVETSSANQTMGQDGVSLITVAPGNASQFSDPQQPGRARVYFNASTGAISEADLAINPNISRLDPFTGAVVPSSFSTDGTVGTYDLESTFVHEIGHMLGLEHSGVLAATMQPRQGVNGTLGLPAQTMRTLSDDDRAGIRTAYGPFAGLGRIQGTVSYNFVGGSPTFGAHVWAEEVATGRVVAGNISLPQTGRYQIDGLPPGQYRVVAEYLDEPVSAGQIASRSGAYQGLSPSNAPPFLTTEVGTVDVAADATRTLNVAVPGGTPSFNPTYIGTGSSGQLSTIPVPVTPGQRVNILIAGDNINTNVVSSVSVNSPFMTVSNVQGIVGFGIPVLSFDVNVSGAAPAGDYSIRLQATSGQVSYISGGLTIEPQATAPPASGSTVQFSAAQYSVGEGDGSLEVVVNRTGDLSSEAKVLLSAPQTSSAACNQKNGAASPRCDYTTVAATLRFAPNESSRRYMIPIINDRYAEGAETFSLTLSSPSGAQLGQQTSATVTILDDDAADATSPIYEAEFFVRQQYRDFLGRDPDPTGLQNWVATLQACPGSGFAVDVPACDRVRVSAGFFQSDEFQARGYFAYRFYSVGLGRRPTYAEFVPDVTRVGGAQSPAEEEQSKQEYAQEFTQRAEFKAKYDQFQDAAAYVTELERAAGVALANRQALVAELAAGLRTRAEVLRLVAESREVEARFYNEAFVAMQYFGYLRRDPDQTGFANWVQTLNQTGNFRHMIFGFIYSDEYIERFGPK